MKKSLLTTVAALLIAAPVMFGQSTKIDIPDIQKRLAKSDVDIQDAKKNTKGAVWLERGDAYLEAAQAPTKGLAKGMTKAELDNAFGQKPVQKDPLKVGNNQYNVVENDRFVGYLKDGKLVLWTENKVIIDSMAFEKAAEAYSKAFFVDAKATTKSYDGLKKVVNIVKDRAQTFLNLGQYRNAAKEYLKSFNIQKLPPIEKLDTTDLFYAAMAATVDENYDTALDLLKQLSDMKYDHEGDVPYYMYFCYMGRDDKENARKVLLEGAKKHPDLEKLYQPLPMLYAFQVDADIKEIEPIMNKALKKDPKNIDIINGLANAYMQRDMKDKALEYFKKAFELQPKEYTYAFNTGYLYLQDADLKVREIREVEDSMSAEELEKAREEIQAIYMQALPYFEQALENRPNDVAATELLRNLTDRLQDTSDEMKAKFEKYDAMAKALNQ